MDESALKKEQFNYKDNEELIRKVKAGDKEALDRVIEMNLPLVSALSKKFLNRGYDYEDIYQIGSIGLIKAINNFDSNYNVKFSTYAVPMIVGEIKRFLRDDGMIKVSRGVKNVAKKLNYDREALTKKLDRDPTVEELSAYSGIDKEEIVFALESVNNINYLYDTIHQDEGSPVLLIDKLSEKESEESSFIDKLALKDALSELDTRARQVIMLRYFKDKTQIQVAKMLGISQVQVSRIEKKVLSKMREMLEE